MQGIKFTVEREDGFSFRFYISSETGDLIIEAGDEKIEIDHVIAMELIEIIRHRLYDHHERTTSFIKRIFE